MERKVIKKNLFNPGRPPAESRLPTPGALKQRPIGRPSNYREGFADLAYKVSLLGATDEELADIFEVSIDSIYDWKNTFPEFAQAVSEGKVQADARVAHSLFLRATGYTYEAEKTVYDSKIGKFVKGSQVEHLPPDVQAAIYWLNNRKPDRWKTRPPSESAGPPPSAPLVYLNPVQVNVSITNEPRRAIGRDS